MMSDSVMKLILALRAAKYSAWSVCDKSFGTMPAKLNRVFAVGQHKAEHHLYAQQQGMKISNDGRLIRHGKARAIITRSFWMFHMDSIPRLITSNLSNGENSSKYFSVDIVSSLVK